MRLILEKIDEFYIEYSFCCFAVIHLFHNAEDRLFEGGNQGTRFTVEMNPDVHMNTSQVQMIR